ncbi:restriction endonuclease subunit S [Enterococcus cecorum]|uniref:restriction endonuclease subunit S n=1 Tax=Enterococcus cecorum TaxID=44008 RepID=UPI003F8FF801
MNEPKLRFKADDGSEFPDWEEKKLGDFGVATGGTSIESEFVNEGKYKVINIGSYSMDNVYKDQGLRVNKTNKTENRILKANDLTMILNDKTQAGNIIGRVLLIDKDDTYVYNQRTERIEVDESSFKSEFLYQYLNADNIRSKIVKSSQGNTQIYVNWSSISNITYNVPSLPEQQKIAEFLSTIDTVIEKQKETVSAWEERKKGVMQKLFSQEVRFKADDGSNFPDWEEKSFLDVFENLNNSTFSRDCLNYEAGNVKYIHYGDILTKFGFAIDVQSSNVPYVNEDLDCEKYASLSDGDIVIADTAEDDTVGRAVEIMNAHCGKTISGLHTIACHPREKFASKYLGYFMNADIYHNQLRPYMQGIKVTSVSKTNIVLTKILVPCLAEQQKIADCLSSLDEVIEKQKATLAAWEELKKGLLQQMFV